MHPCIQWLTPAWAKTLAVVIVLVVSVSAQARDVKGAQAAVDAAAKALQERQYVVAAEQMERAFALDDNPLWLANAGYAHMMAGENDKAIDALTQALANAELSGEGRTRAVDRLGKASAAKTFVERARAQALEGNFTKAAKAYDDAYDTVGIGRYALAAAEAWEKAHDLKAADDRYRKALAAKDLDPPSSQRAADGITRVGNGTPHDPGDPRPDPNGPDGPDGPDGPERPIDAPGGTPWLGWGLATGGVVVAVTGVVLLAVGNGKASDLAGAQRTEPVTDLSRKEAQGLASDAKTFQTVGLLTAIIGGAVAATGFVLVATHEPTPEGHVDVQASVTPDGLFVGLGGHW